MSDPADLRHRLLERQQDGELQRKANKARRRGFWTQEDLDLATLQGARRAEKIEWE